MPIIQGIRRINPLDLNRNVKIGVAFPLNEVNITTGTQTVNEQLKTNFLNLLLILLCLSHNLVMYYHSFVTLLQ